MSGRDFSRRSNKKRISEYFARGDEPEGKKAKKDQKENEEIGQSTNKADEQVVDVQNLKCPRKKVLVEEKKSDGIAAEEGTGDTKAKRVKMIELGKGQMVLDAGQAKIGNLTCAECGMVYCVDDAEDMKIHEKFHEQFLNRYQVNIDLVPMFCDFNSRKYGIYHVHYIPSNVAIGFKKMLLTHMKDINAELGYTPKDDLFSEKYRIFMICMMTRKGKWLIAAVCVSEKVEDAFTDKTRKSINIHADPADWIVGIDRIWVNPRYRRKGLAYALLDAATTQDKLMEFRIRRLRIAFSDPTDDGRILARKFMQTRYMPADRFNGEILLY